MARKQKITQDVAARKAAPIDREKSLELRRQFLVLMAGDDETLPVSVFGACRRLDIHISTVRRWRRDDPEFDEQYQDALEAGADVMEDEATRRAVQGVDEPIYQGGELVGHKRVYSDTLMQFMLAGRRPDKYRRNTTTNVAVINEPTGPRDIAKALGLLLEEAKKTEAVDG